MVASMTANSDKKGIRFRLGQVYFIVMYDDERLAVPVVQTLVYLGEGRSRDGRLEFRFKEIKPTKEPSLFVVDQEHADDLVVDQDGLIERLRNVPDRNVDA
jgi:hypothetical protein